MTDSNAGSTGTPIGADQRGSEIAALLREDRVFPPPAAFRERANVRDSKIYEEAERDP